MTHVICLYGGPGTGKSTQAAYLFYLLKAAGVNAELVTEYVKQWAWEDRKPLKYDQFYFFGQQARREYSLFGKVDVLVTDSPVPLCGYYAKLYGTQAQSRCLADMIRTYYGMVLESGATYHHVFLRRLTPYDPTGRFETAEEALAIDRDMRAYLTSIGIAFDDVDATGEAVGRWAGGLFPLTGKGDHE